MFRPFSDGPGPSLTGGARGGGLTWAASFFYCRRALRPRPRGERRFESCHKWATQNKLDGSVSYLRTAAGILVLGCLALEFGKASAQSSKDNQDSKDEAVYLVARDVIGDPFFHESVVLMLQPIPENPAVTGLIVNKPTRVPLSEIFPDDPALKKKTQVAFFGGPVDTDNPVIVFRSKKAAKQAMLVFGDVYVSFDRAFIKGVLEKPELGQDVRLFLGRAQWAPDQLHDEVLSGAWDNVRAEGSLIFGADQSYLWHTLSERAEPVPVARLASRASAVL